MSIRRSVVDARLFTRLNFGDSYEENEAFSNDKNNLGHFCEQLLLFDNIVIPTLDFGIIPGLIEWMGLDYFEEALNQNTFTFARRLGILAYAGNGRGLTVMTMPERDNQGFNWSQKALFGTIDVAIEEQLYVRCANIQASRRNHLIDKVLHNTIEINMSNESVDRLSAESYSDVENERELYSFVQAGSGLLPAAKINLSRLPMLKANEARILGSRSVKDPVDLILRVADINIELQIAAQVNNADLITSEGAERVLKGKLARAGMAQVVLDQFVTLLDLNKLPSIDKAVASGLIEPKAIWKFRSSNVARQFRGWLSSVRTEDLRELEREYVAAISQVAPVESIPAKFLRLAATTTIGLFNTPLGVAASAVDTFFVGNWLSGYNPRLFFSSAEKSLFSKPLNRLVLPNRHSGQSKKRK